jgi:predicted FMN-binding regulatory protein PaiB/N-acetylglutamate synthase-like GNAT family acetyltransferase
MVTVHAAMRLVYHKCPIWTFSTYQARAIVLPMRKAIYAASDDEARALFARADVVHLALVSADGAPIFRTFNAVVVDGALAFHGAPAGEKMEGLGRPCVAAAEETVASIPSWFLDPERACPATTYYVAAQAHGTLEAVEDPGRKARVLRALMQKYQPEGRHAPVDAESPLYARAIDRLLVAGVRLDRVACKAKLGQNRKPEDRMRVVEHLWRRGAPGGVRAVALLLARFPELGTPAFLAGPPGVRLQCEIEDADLDAVADLLAGAYWLDTTPRDVVRAAIAASTARVAARDGEGRLVGFARALSDGKVAWLYDVIVAPRMRGAGVGCALLRLLLDHPVVRTARHLRLSTRDADGYYRRFGFQTLDEAARHPWRSIEMIKTVKTSR